MKDDDEDQVKGKERKFLVNFARKFNKALKYRWEIIKLFLTFILNIYYIYRILHINSRIQYNIILKYNINDIQDW